MSADQYLIQLVIDHLTNNVTWVQPGTIYLALYTDAACSSEKTGGSYARQVLPFPAMTTNATSTTNIVAVTFTGMPAGQVAGAGVFDSSVGGNRFMYLALPTVLTLAGGDTVSYAAGQLILTGL